jgi:hypothetical protein
MRELYFRKNKVQELSSRCRLQQARKRITHRMSTPFEDRSGGERTGLEITKVSRGTQSANKALKRAQNFATAPMKQGPCQKIDAGIFGLGMRPSRRTTLP